MTRNTHESREERRAAFIETMKRRQVLSLLEPLERKLGSYREGKLPLDDLFKSLHFIMAQSDKIVKRYRNRPDVILAEIAMDETKYTTEIGEIVVRARHADITMLFADAIVNPADPRGVMAAGVAAAIKEAGGAEIEKEAVSKTPIGIGKPVATSAGTLPNLHVIHVAVAEEPGGSSSPEKVRAAAAAALSLAEELGVESIALPALGTGAGGLSLEDSAGAITAAIEAHARRSVTDVTLVGRDEKTVAALAAALERWDEEHE
jgi:O-acetyl-ADP-ribose deacetylase (regulator of RNase III)